MRTLLVSQEYPPETGWGGVGSYTYVLAHALARAGLEVHVLSVARGQTPRSAQEHDGVWVHRRPLATPRGIGRLTRMPESIDRLTVAWSAWRAFEELDIPFDVIQCPAWKAEGWFLQRHRPAPVVVWLSSLAFQILAIGGRTGRDARLASRLELDTIRRADRVVSPAGHAAVVAGHAGMPLDGIRLVGNPVEMRAPAPPAPPGPPHRVMFAGRYEPRKSPETILRAAPAVLAEHPSTRFVFVGRDSASGGHPSYRAWMEREAARLEVAHAIEFVDGWQEDAVARELARSHVCAVPSVSESFGYVAAEASCAGRPVVASRIAGLSEIVEHGESGLLADPREPGEWAERISALLRDPGRAAAMGAAGRALMAARFAPEVVAGRMIEIYAETAERFASRSGRPARHAVTA